MTGAFLLTCLWYTVTSVLVRAVPPPQASCPSDLPTVSLKQESFDRGTVVITKPGVYRLLEDITFRPSHPATVASHDLSASEPELFLHPKPVPPYNTLAYSLGFFAAIAVVSQCVDIDLNGFTIQQSREHRLTQRFYSHIELGSSPFRKETGPAEFVGDEAFQVPRNLRIRNGHLGASSHHGIHGNGVAGNPISDIQIEDLTFRHFEVAAISLNGVEQLNITNCDIRETSDDVSVHGRLSQARFLAQAITTRLGITGIEDVKDKAQRTLEKFENVLEKRELVRRQLFFCVSDPLTKCPKLYRTETDGLPDGSMTAGLIIHPDFNVDYFHKGQRDGSKYINIEGLRVTDIAAIPLEVGTLVLRSSLEEPRLSHVSDIAGAVSDFDHMAQQKSDEEGPFYEYLPNALADLQIATAELVHHCCARDRHPNCEKTRCQTFCTPESAQGSEFCYTDANVARILSRNSIPTSIVEWSKRSGNQAKELWLDILSDYAVAPNHDQMFHENKGVIAVKIDGATQVSLKDVDIHNIRNLSNQNHRSTIAHTCGESEAFEKHHRPYEGHTAAGITLASTADVVGEACFGSIKSRMGPQNEFDVREVFNTVGTKILRCRR